MKLFERLSWRQKNVPKQIHHFVLELQKLSWMAWAIFLSCLNLTIGENKHIFWYYFSRVKLHVRTSLVSFESYSLLMTSSWHHYEIVERNPNPSPFANATSRDNNVIMVRHTWCHSDTWCSSLGWVPFNQFVILWYMTHDIIVLHDKLVEHDQHKFPIQFNGV